MRDHLYHKAPYDIEIRLLHANGEYVWVQSKGQAVWDDKGKPLRMAGSISEITHLMRAENRAGAEEHYRRALEIHPDYLRAHSSLAVASRVGSAAVAGLASSLDAA